MAGPARHSPKRAIAIGVAIVVVAAMLIASPLVLGGGRPIKYIVAFGVAGACLGISVLLHGTWDWLRSNRSQS